MVFTNEQLEIIESIPMLIVNKRKLCINAYAGTGKTTTLRGIVESHQEHSFTYIAFNESIAKEFNMLMLKNCKASTINALALSVVKPNKIVDKHSTNSIASIFKIPFKRAKEIRAAYESYCNSMEVYLPDEVDGLVVELIAMEQNGDIPYSHIGYLKRYQLGILSGEFTLESDCLMVDEAQDSNPVTLSIINSFNNAVIAVGDRHQGIYSFRGAINAMEQIKSDLSRSLTVNFRSNANVIDKANRILRLFRNDDVEISVGSKNIKTDGTTAKISRYNSTLIEEMFASESFNTTRSLEKIFSPVLAIHFWDTMQDHKIAKQYRFLLSIKNKKSLLEYIQSSGDKELYGAMDIVERYKKTVNIEEMYKIILSKYDKNSQLMLTTAHSSKGLEFDNVTIMSDFPLLEKGVSCEESSVYYVACTRARHRVIDLSKNDMMYFLPSCDKE